MRDITQILGVSVEVFFFPPQLSHNRLGRAGWMAAINGENYGEWIALAAWSDGVRELAREILLEQAEESIALIIDKNHAKQRVH